MTVRLAEIDTIEIEASGEDRAARLEEIVAQLGCIERATQVPLPDAPQIHPPRSTTTSAINAPSTSFVLFIVMYQEVSVFAAQDGGCTEGHLLITQLSSRPGSVLI